ncbi:MAG: DEAD/DEAH box helicase [gamma proteobacterium endosymbiont of Lamellibrachia anaximandri]|nr:DEAD/DEAH box helicase [gamma proteobacterium endosymbiont of Lamellibrachia anaximandri]
MKQRYFSELLPDLAERAQQAAISRLGFANVPLRRHLRSLFEGAYGQSGAFLADPTFEAVFGWSSGNKTLADLEGQLLSPDLVTAMDEAGNYRFGRDIRPYTHQIEAWETLAEPDPQSLIVASGTGSGKTECFMIPILDRLLRQRQEQQGKLIGVRALFLYPLNALINSQRHRLSAWTEPFGGDVRFCLYNGTTPERPDRARKQREHPSEIRDRQALRGTPPPILVTNSTMLEYMLVRTLDVPILEQSQGKLEWVVLDEAHTYIGSQAAEMALLIRRVLNAFGVKPEQVRFVATSATIGDPKGKAGQDLRRFLAEVAGVDPGRVRLVSGERQVPVLAPAVGKTELSLEELAAIEPDREVSSERYDALSHNGLARRIRGLFTDPAKGASVARLSEVCADLFGQKESYSLSLQQKALHWLDLLSATRNEDDEAFLPLRGHFYHQTLSGIWACADPECTHKQGTALQDPQWPFGQIYLEPRKHCECGSPVYELINCTECGSVHLLGMEERGQLLHAQPSHALDDFELEIETDDSTDEKEPVEKGMELSSEPERSVNQHRVLIVNRQLPGVGPLDVERVGRKIVESSEETLRVLAHEDAGSGLMCPVCETEESARRILFRHARLGAPFLLGGILPTLLEYAPDGSEPGKHPYRGRRLLTFNDSRQGTARMAANLQLDAERSRVRGLVYHLALQRRLSDVGSDVEKLKKEIATLEEANKQVPNVHLEQMIADKKRELDELNQPRPISFFELAQQLTRQGRDFEYMLQHYHRYAPDLFGQGAGELQLTQMFLVREFGRRPRRDNSLETMGLVAIRYPVLEDIDRLPETIAQATDFDLQTWKDFLKLCLDFFVRGGGSLAFPSAWRSWLGMQFPQSWIVPRDQENTGRYQRRWPKAKRSGLQSTLVRLLSHVLQADIETDMGADRIDVVLQAAWDTLCIKGLLKQEADGRVLPLDQLAFSPIEQAWACPVTRRFLDTTLRGITPYLPRKATDESAHCQQWPVSIYNHPFGDVTDDQERTKRARAWLAEQAGIEALREQGLWSNLNDKVIELAPYFKAAEHSAQQDSVALQRYEKAFQEGDINLLSCSTTMEMGIDIGGISMVAMNNVPPHPSNYLQRAGRAGRRQESRSLAMTLCKSNPHDQAVFNNTRWPFDTALPAPKVSLDSPRIVQRHVHSYLLSKFLIKVLKGSDQEQLRLTCGAFFSGDSSMAERFMAWCRRYSARVSSDLKEGMTQLLRHTVLESQALAWVMNLAIKEMKSLAQTWREEWKNLDAEIQQIKRESGEKSPAYRAVAFHMKRLEEEYLLRELATRGYLPAYGFPTNIAPFDNLTIGQFKRKKAEEEQRKRREDNRYRRREMASRDLATALREYAPGSEIVMDGLVYRSAGVTLNWHVPADQEEVREVQNIRHAWRCHHCGASGSAHNWETACHCENCGAETRQSNIQEYLEPAGFAVDFYRDPTNDITTQHFVPVERPWVDAQSQWFPLPNPDLGRFRATAHGHLFHQSRGINGTGYALCLECGRAEPMTPFEKLPNTFTQPHPKLRRSKEEGVYCPGSTDNWKIKEGIALGHETWTDLFELQLKSENGVWLNDSIAALTLAVALRDALAGLIGVQTNELSCDVKPIKSEDGTQCQSILVFDRYAAGYASSVERFMDRLFERARKHLECPANCDSVCPHCVLDFDQRFAAEKMDRHRALEVLSRNWLNLHKLPEEYAYFGAASCSEYKTLSESILGVVSRKVIQQIRLYAGGEVDDWDVALSPLKDLVYLLGSKEIDVQVMLLEGAIDALEEGDRYLLASMAQTPYIEIHAIQAIPRYGKGWLLAETLSGESVKWAADSAAALQMGLQWGLVDGPLVMTNNDMSGSVDSKPITAEKIRPSNIEIGDRELEIHRELDGPLKGLGDRFWSHLSSMHAPTEELLSDSNSQVIYIAYRDRYLFTPLSVRLLAEIISGLRDAVGRERWKPGEIEVFTLECRPDRMGRSRYKVWSDWYDTGIRDQVLVSTFDLAGLQAKIQIGDPRKTGHGRLLEISFSSGKRLTVRFDQGVSYWRVSHSAANRNTYFDHNEAGSLAQSKKLMNLTIPIEAANLATQLFLKIR